MAEIKIKQKEYYCEKASDKFCTQCLTEYAMDVGCKHYGEIYTERHIIPFGDCIYADYKYKYRGLSVKNYEVEEFKDNYNPHLDCAIVKTRNAVYDNCVKVEIDGECVYNAESEE